MTQKFFDNYKLASIEQQDVPVFQKQISKALGTDVIINILKETFDDMHSYEGAQHLGTLNFSVTEYFVTAEETLKTKLASVHEIRYVHNPKSESPSIRLNDTGVLIIELNFDNPKWPEGGIKTVLGSVFN